ncbi:hypothetical protein HOO65_090181 [Ceratocystis lukuohia]|uniref:Uncharacterized protein n=1 Tax=Ceratocystis lukuohia TaxID=2019550 RepID=A0ABR4M9D5_9PEZI
MKSPLSYLPVALPFFGLIQGSIIEDHGYKLTVEGHKYEIYSPYYYGGDECLDGVKFYPKEKFASISFADSDQEPEHTNRLGLAEIFNTLCQEEDIDPDDMNGLSFEVNLDQESDDDIAVIREDRKLSPIEEVKILPSDKEWNWVVQTSYYQKLKQLIKKPVQKALIRGFYETNIWDENFPANTIYFLFTPPVDDVSSAEAASLFDDIEEQGAALEALFDEDQGY